MTFIPGGPRRIPGLKYAPYEASSDCKFHGILIRKGEEVMIDMKLRPPKQGPITFTRTTGRRA